MTHVYLTRSDMKLGFSQGRLVAKTESGDLNYSIPFCNVESINVFGSPQISTQLIRECLSSGVPIGYYSEDGHYFGKALSSKHVDPGRQKRQVLLTDDHDFCLTWAKIVIEAKIRNSLAVLRSAEDLYSFSPEELEGIDHSFRYLRKALTIDEAMGFEGNAAKCYFSCYSKLFADSGFEFTGRSARPPKDPINALLSYGYSVLHRSIIGAIERHGLHPYFGFMHAMQKGHAALASDLIEDSRAFLVDKTVLAFVRSGIVSDEDFIRKEGGAVYASRNAMKEFTGFLTNEMSAKNRYFHLHGDDFNYGFHAALDKKLCSAINAIDAGDANLYQPFYWGIG